MELIPSVSVIVSNYNYAIFLPEAIESVLGQSYQNFELIVVDDGSKDDSRCIINKYLEDFPDKIKGIYKENAGQASAFNAGFNAAKGDIIAFLDADDYWYPDKLETIVYYHKDYSGVQHNLLINNKRKYTMLNDLVAKQQAALMEYGFLGMLPTSGLSFIKKSLDAIFPIPESKFKICADLYVKNMFLLEDDLFSIDKPLGVYRVHDSNHWFSDRKKIVPHINYLINILNSIRAERNQKNIPYKPNGESFSNYLYSTLSLEEHKRYIIYGTGSMGAFFYGKMKEKMNVVGFASSFVDNNQFCGLPILNIDELKNEFINFDYLVVASQSMVEIVEFLIQNNVPIEKILYPKI